tara:strand:+ start:307 stop:480 length:174 start_codon:yes stop_codon:yes gene_type:complete
MVNEVTKKDINGAFNYFMDTGRLEEVNLDDRYYIKVLLKVIANAKNIELVFEDEEQE